MGNKKHKGRGGTERRFRSKRNRKEFSIESRLLRTKRINGGGRAYTGNERKREGKIGQRNENMKQKTEPT